MNVRYVRGKITVRIDAWIHNAGISQAMEKTPWFQYIKIFKQRQSVEQQWPP